MYRNQKDNGSTETPCIILLFQSQEKHVQVNSVYANSGFAMGEELETPKDENDMIHYGEVYFSTLQTKSTTEKISGLETMYAEVCGSGKH